MTQNAQSSLRINKGVCYALYAYDVGMSIDIEKCKSLITSGVLNADIRPHRRAPKYFDYRPAPLLVTQVITPRAISGYKTSGNVDLLLYDFGGVSVSYEIPFTGSLDTLRSHQRRAERKLDASRRLADARRESTPSDRRGRHASAYRRSCGRLRRLPDRRLLTRPGAPTNCMRSAPRIWRRSCARNTRCSQTRKWPTRWPAGSRSARTT